MTVYIRPNGDDENDGSEKGSGQITQARNRHREPEQGSRDQFTDDRLGNRELGAEEDEFPQGGG